MAARKTKKMPMKKMEMDSCDCECCDSNATKIESSFLILLGAVGLAMAIGAFNFGAWNIYFQYLWSITVIVIGMMMLMNRDGCC